MGGRKECYEGERIGEVEAIMANVLSEGTGLYLSRKLEIILIAEYDGETKYYLQAMGE